MANPSQLLFFALALILCANIPAGAEETGEAESEVPSALKADCKWERRDDYSKPPTLRDYSKKFKRYTEQRCKEECGKMVICGYTNFNNKTRECQLIPRRAFHESYRGGQGKYVMWEKKCPIEHIWNRTDDPSRMVMCPMTKPSDSAARLSPKYAYKAARYLDETEATWWCQRDALCQGIFRNRTYNNVHVFLYKAVIDEGATGVVSEVNIKNCTKPSVPMRGSDCWFTAYNRKEVNGTSYQSVRSKNFRECYSLCVADGACYAAAATEDSYRRGRQTCKLYHKEGVDKLLDFKKRFDNAKVWVRDVCQ